MGQLIKVEFDRVCDHNYHLERYGHCVFCEDSFRRHSERKRIFRDIIIGIFVGSIFGLFLIGCLTLGNFH